MENTFEFNFHLSKFFIITDTSKRQDEKKSYVHDGSFSLFTNSLMAHFLFTVRELINVNHKEQDCDTKKRTSTLQAESCGCEKTCLSGTLCLGHKAAPFAMQNTARYNRRFLKQPNFWPGRYFTKETINERSFSSAVTFAFVPRGFITFSVPDADCKLRRDNKG